MQSLVSNFFTSSINTILRNKELRNLISFIFFAAFSKFLFPLFDPTLFIMLTKLLHAGLMEQLLAIYSICKLN